MFLMSLVAVSSLVSCNSSSSDYWNASCFVTVQGTSTNYNFVSDDGVQFIVADNRVPSYAPSYGDRAVIYFRILEDPNNTSTTRYSITLYDVTLVETGFTSADPTVDSPGDDPVQIYSYAGTPYMGTTKKYLNAAVYFAVSEASKLSQHTFTLTYVDRDNWPEDKPNTDGYLYLELRHDAGDDAIVDGKTYNTYAVWYSFPLAELDMAGLLDGVNGIVLGMKGSNDGKMIYYNKLEWPKEN